MNINIIREKCKDEGITFAELERKLDFGNGAIRKWEDAAPSITRVKKVADYFRCSVDDLLTEES